MQRESWRRVAFLVALLALGAVPRDAQEAAPPASGAGPARVGERVPDHEFAVLDWHDGRTRLSQLRGHPVLVAGWRQWIPEPSGLHAAWLADRLLDEFADDGLIVILEDRKEWSDERWWGARSFWIRSFGSPVWFAAGHPETTGDLPIARTESKRDDRSAVLIGVDGTLVFEGTVEDAGEGPVGERIRDLVKEEIGRREKGWGEDRDLARARGLAFGDGKHAAALEAAARSHAPAREVDSVRAEIEGAFEAQLASVRYLVARGRYAEAEERFEALERGARGHDAFVAAALELASHFEGAEAKQARKLERSLTKILAPIAKDDWRKIDLDSLFTLRELASEKPDHPLCARAARLDPLISDLARIARGVGSTKTWEETIRRREEKERR